MKLYPKLFQVQHKSHLYCYFLKSYFKSYFYTIKWIIKTGGLPNISFVARKPKPLGTEFKCIADGEKGIMLGLEVCEGKEAMQNKEGAKELVV